MNRHVAELAKAAGADYLDGASVEQVELGDEPHRVHYARGRRAGGADGALGDRLPAAGAPCSAGSSASPTRSPALDTAVGVEPLRERQRRSGLLAHLPRRRSPPPHDPLLRPGLLDLVDPPARQPHVGRRLLRQRAAPARRQDRRPRLLGDDAQVPAGRPTRSPARAPLEPYQYYAHLPYNSRSTGCRRSATRSSATPPGSPTRSTRSASRPSCRQLAMLAPIVVGRRARRRRVRQERRRALNEEFGNTQKAVLALNRFKYKEGWHRPHVVMQTALYELGEIAELYHLQDPRRWTAGEPAEALPHAVGHRRSGSTTSSASRRRRCATAIAISTTTSC